MEIHLQLYSILREKLPEAAHGKADLELEEGATIADLLKKLDISRRVVVSINDDHVSDRSHKLQEGDEVKLFSSIGGG